VLVVQAMEGKLLKGEERGGLLEVTRKKEEEIRRREEELARRRAEEEASAARIRDLQSAAMAAEDKYTGLADEAEKKTKKLKKLVGTWGQVVGGRLRAVMPMCEGTTLGRELCAAGNCMVSSCRAAWCHACPKQLFVGWIEESQLGWEWKPLWSGALPAASHGFNEVAAIHAAPHGEGPAAAWLAGMLSPPSPRSLRLGCSGRATRR
jgi:hypothetical protein